MPASPETIRRLAFIRLLLDRAEDLGRQPAPYGTDAINRAHDVSEMWLALAVQELGGSIPRDFMGYWPVLTEKLGRPLSHHTQLNKVNKTRVNLKHYGIQPADAEVGPAVAAVRSLIVDETPDIFGLALDQVSLASFVTSPDAAKWITGADESWSNHEHLRAMSYLRLAFEDVVKNYTKTKSRGRWTGSIFTSIAALRSPSLRLSSRSFSEIKDLNNWATAIDDSVHQLDENVTLIGLGIDLRRYGMFNVLTPTISARLSGNLVTRGRQNAVYTKDQFEFCRDFVIQTSLYLAEFDYSLESFAHLFDRSSEVATVTITPEDRLRILAPSELDAQSSDV